jgi:hypothetical protein
MHIVVSSLAYPNLLGTKRFGCCCCKELHIMKVCSMINLIMSSIYDKLHEIFINDGQI